MASQPRDVSEETPTISALRTWLSNAEMVACCGEIANIQRYPAQDRHKRGAESAPSLFGAHPLGQHRATHDIGFITLVTAIKRST